ncbi:MAG: hypothetical protein R2851_24585 [Caldilineaceae bacterium]
MTALFADLKAGILPLLDRIRQQDEPQADFSIAPIRPRNSAPQHAPGIAPSATISWGGWARRPIPSRFHPRQDVRFTTRYRALPARCGLRRLPRNGAYALQARALTRRWHAPR